MLKYASQVTISRPPHEVWPFVADPAKQALWSDVPMRPLTHGAFGVGTRISVSFGRRPLHAAIGLEMTEVTPEHVMAWRTFELGPITWDGSYRLEPVEGGSTRITQNGTLVFHRLWRFVEPMIGAEIRSGEVRELERLKQVVESGAAGRGSTD